MLTLSIEDVFKGDVPGHDFHGNQWTSGGAVLRFHPANPREMGGVSHHTLEAWDPKDADTDWAKARPEERDRYTGSADDPGTKPIGSISWSHQTGEIKGVFVAPEHQRQGLATHLLTEARKVAAETRGVREPKHSTFRTKAGEAWARSLGERLPVQKDRLIDVLKGDTPGHEFHGNQYKAVGEMSMHDLMNHFQEQHGVNTHLISGVPRARLIENHKHQHGKGGRRAPRYVEHTHTKEVKKGDVAGHEFHGNQWTGGAGADASVKEKLHQPATKKDVKDTYLKVKDDGWDVTVPPATQKLIKETWNGKYGGLRSKVTQIEGYKQNENGQPTIKVDGMIYKGNTAVGNFTRTINPNGDDPTEIHHDFLQLEPGVQGQGFADEFNLHAMSSYMENGITHVTVNANIDIGGYTWAKQGFEWDNEPGAWDSVSERLYDFASYKPDPEESDPSIHADWYRPEYQIKNSDDVPASVRTEAKQAAVKLERQGIKENNYSRDQIPGVRAKSKIPSPQDIVRIGIDNPYTGYDGRMTWAGKDILLGSNWYGNLNLATVK